MARRGTCSLHAQGLGRRDFRGIIRRQIIRVREQNIAVAGKKESTPFSIFPQGQLQLADG